MKLGVYEIDSELARGGMGVVFRARGPDGGLVAIKLVRDAARAGAASRFAREARIQASLGEAEGFVPVLDSGESPQGPFIVMPLVPGGNLRERLVRGPLTVDETLDLGCALARAMGQAHAGQIVHRDLKPENILFAADGRPLITDMGLAKHVDAAHLSMHLSRTGEVRGTMSYMPREQMQDAKRVGPEANVFALGAILYECLAGEPAFGGASAMEALARVDTGKFVDLEAARPGTPRWLAATIGRALARDPEDRWEDAGKLEAALRAGPVAAGGPRSVALGFGLGVGAVLLVLGTWVAVRAPPSAPPRAPTPPRSPEARTGAAGSARPGERADDLVASGEKRLAADDAEGAIADLTRAIELAPGLASAWASRGEARRRRGDLDGAFADLDRAVALDGRASSLRARALVQSTRGLVEDALADLTRAIELEPSFAQTWAERGFWRFARGDQTAAIEDANRAIELDSTLGYGFSVRGTARLARGEPGAMEDLSRAVDLDPKDTNAWQNLGEARRGAGDLPGAVAAQDQAIALAPAFVNAWCSRGRARYAQHDLDGASSDCTRAIELDPRLATAWATRGCVRRDRNERASAREDFTRALELDPRLMEAWAYRAAIDYNDGKLDGAIADYGRAIALQPSAAWLWSNRAEARRRTGDLDGAIEDATRAIELTPRVSSGWVNRGAARVSKGEVAASLPDFDRALELDPGNLAALASRASVRLTLGDLDGALADAERAIRADTTLAVAWFTRGEARRRKGSRGDDVLADLDKALTLDPRLADAWCARGRVRAAQGNVAAAVVDLSRFLDLAPTDPEAPSVRATLAELAAKK